MHKYCKYLWKRRSKIAKIHTPLMYKQVTHIYYKIYKQSSHDSIYLYNLHDKKIRWFLIERHTSQYNYHLLLYISDLIFDIYMSKAELLLVLTCWYSTWNITLETKRAWRQKYTRALLHKTLKSKLSQKNQI